MGRLTVCCFFAAVAVVAAALASGPLAGRAGSPAEKEIARLIDALGDEDFEARRKAEAALLKIGGPALDALARAGESGDLEVRRQARWLIGLIHAARWDRLIGRLSETAKAAEAAKELAGLLAGRDRLQSGGARDALAKAAKAHRDAAVRKAASAILDAHFGPRVAALVSQLADPSAERREAAEKALLEIGSPAMPRLKAAARGDDPEVRLRAGVLAERIELAGR